MREQDNTPFITNTEYYKLIQAMRQTFSRSEYAKSIRDSARSKVKGSRGGIMTTCGECGKAHKPTNTELHHLDPVIPIGKHYTELTLQEIWERLWCDRDRLIMLCHSCHDKITQEQNIERKK